MNYLDEKELIKSKAYLENLLPKKTQGAKSQLSNIFNAEVFTTSRAESCNAIIKRYLNSKSEVSDLISFVLAFEKNYANRVEQIGNPDISVASIPLVKELKGFLTLKLYLIQMKGFGKACSYDHRLKEEENSNSDLFEVWFVNTESPAATKIHDVALRERFCCDCQYFERMGLICKHILHMCIVKSVKSLENLRISNRWRHNLDNMELLHFTSFDIHRNIMNNDRRVLSLDDPEETEQTEQREVPREEEKKGDPPSELGEDDGEDERNHVKKKVIVKNFEKKKTNNKGAPRKGSIIFKRI